MKLVTVTRPATGKNDSKTYVAIVVLDAVAANKIEQLVKDIDPDEYNDYWPTAGLVVVVTPKSTDEVGDLVIETTIRPRYTSKFFLDFDELYARAKKAAIPVAIFYTTDEDTRFYIDRIRL